LNIKPIDLIAATGDWHLNDTVALCPPVFKLEKKSEHRPGPVIMSFYIAWKEYWDIIAEKAQELETQLYRELLGAKYSKSKARKKAKELLQVKAICLGDLADINSHEKVQLITQNENDIQRALVTVAQPMMDVVDSVFVIRGTKAHTGPNGKLEEWFAEDCKKAIHCDYEGSASWWKLKASFQGVKIDAQHHPPTGSMLPNKRDQSAARAAERVATAYLRAGMVSDTPDLILYGHRHYKASGTELGVRCRYLPAWKLVGSFGYRLSVALAEPVGGYWVVCRDGKIMEEPFDSGSGPFELWEPPRMPRYNA